MGLRINIIGLTFHQDLSAHWLEKYVGEKDGIRKTSYEIFAKNPGERYGMACVRMEVMEVVRTGWILYMSWG